MILSLMGILLLMLTKPSTGIWCRTCDKCDPGTNWGHKYCPERNVCGLDVSNHDRSTQKFSQKSQFKTKLIHFLATAKQYCMNGDFLPPLTIGCHIFYDVRYTYVYKKCHFHNFFFLYRKKV